MNDRIVSRAGSARATDDASLVTAQGAHLEVAYSAVRIS
jgi:hypothetical protein